MNLRPMHASLLLAAILFARASFAADVPLSSIPEPTADMILTPPAPPQPRIHGAMIFGVRPGHPLLYTIAATGDRPMRFSADGLPAGVQIDSSNGQISGTIATPEEVTLTLHATNALGSAERKLKLLVGDQIALTPPMGWNSYNCWGTGITQERELAAARAFVKSGLSQHGWSYINMDGGWEGARGGELKAIQPDPKRFTDIKAMVDEIHTMGLRAGIYSTPWVTTYGGQVGGSSDNPDGTWDPKTMLHGAKNKKLYPFAIGKYHFFTNDAKQWAAWGIDYVKWDWAPNELPETKEMHDALNASGRDLIFSLSNNTTNSLFAIIPEMSQVANCWRIGGDISDRWQSIVSHGFNQDKWAPYAGPGHWNDPDMFEIGAGGGGKRKRLTADEQYTHVSQWCLVSAPLLLGCDLDHLTPFTLGLLTNDEVIDIDQDELGKEATSVSKKGNSVVYAKPLADGSWAAGLYNLGATPASVTLNWTDIQRSGTQRVRDLWRQKDLGQFTDSFSANVIPHGVVLVKISSAQK
jgi:alpha-galactosidase